MKYAVFALFLLAAACSDDGESEGIHVAIAVDGATMPRTVALNDGTSATLEPSYVTVVGWGLEECSSLARTLWRAIDPLPRAFAHGGSSPTNLGVPVVVAVAGVRDGVEVGHLEPPPGRYCGLTLSIGAADDDAVKLPDAGMVGKTLRVEGEHQGVPFSVSSAASAHAHLTFATPLELSAEKTHADIVVALDTSDTFDAVDFGSASAAADILTGLIAGFSVTVQ